MKHYSNYEYEERDPKLYMHKSPYPNEEAELQDLKWGVLFTAVWALLTLVVIYMAVTGKL